jgi:hypothetical protein
MEGGPLPTGPLRTEEDLEAGKPYRTKKKKKKKVIHPSVPQTSQKRLRWGKVRWEAVRMAKHRRISPAEVVELDQNPRPLMRTWVTHPTIPGLSSFFHKMGIMPTSQSC